MSKAIPVDTIIALDLIKHLYEDTFCHSRLVWDTGVFDGVCPRLDPSRLYFHQTIRSPGIVFTKRIHVRGVSYQQNSELLRLGVVLRNGAIGLSSSFHGLSRPSTIFKHLLEHNFTVTHSYGSSVSDFQCYDYMVDIHDTDYKLKHLSYLTQLIKVISEVYAASTGS